MTEETRLTDFTASLDNLAQILCDNGVHVVQVIKENKWKHPPFITFFSNDNNEGMRVAQIALDHGYPVLKFEHHWYYDELEENEAETGFSHIWSISIKRFAPGTVPGEGSPLRPIADILRKHYATLISQSDNEIRFRGHPPYSWEAIDELIECGYQVAHVYKHCPYNGGTRSKPDQWQWLVLFNLPEAAE